MNLNGWNVILAQAPAAGSMQDPPQAQMLKMIVPFVLMFVALYFVMIRPQSKKAKEHALLLKAIKPGDQVVTSGGVKGIVVNVKDDGVIIRSVDTKFEILKSAVVEITKRGDSGPGES